MNIDVNQPPRLMTLEEALRRPIAAEIRRADDSALKLTWSVTCANPHDHRHPYDDGCTRSILFPLSGAESFTIITKLLEQAHSAVTVAYWIEPASRPYRPLAKSRSNYFRRM